MNIELTKAEAIVLFEWLHNYSQNTEFNDEAAKCVLWNIECQLERALVEPFDKKYLEILAQAKEAVKGNY